MPRKNGTSTRVAITDWSVPICEPIPRASSIKKKMMDQKGATGSCPIASVKTIKTSPVPSTDLTMHSNH